MSNSRKEEKITTIEEIADIVFGVFPPEEVESYDLFFNGKRLSMRDRFVVHFTSSGMKPRKDLTRYYLEKATLQMILDTTFVLEKPKFTLFDCFFEWQD